MTDLSILKAEVLYYPYPEPTQWSCTNYHLDQPKLNLLWLVHPTIDTLIDKAWGGDDVSHSIDVNMSSDLRKILCGPPIEFMRDFSRMGDLAIADPFPTGYMTTMWARAREANARLCAGLEPNVFKVDFRNKRRFG